MGFMGFPFRPIPSHLSHSSPSSQLEKYFSPTGKVVCRTWQSRQDTPAMLTDKTLQCSVAAHAQRGGIGIEHRPCFRAYGRIERHALCIRLLSAGPCPFSSPAVFLFTHNFVPLRQITPNGAVLGTPPLGFT